MFPRCQSLFGIALSFLAFSVAPYFTRLETSVVTFLICDRFLLILFATAMTGVTGHNLTPDIGGLCPGGYVTLPSRQAYFQSTHLFTLLSNDKTLQECLCDNKTAFTLCSTRLNFFTELIHNFKFLIFVVVYTQRH